jgi:hypothetical protein
MRDSRECRQHAQECLRLAQKATTGSARQHYNALANTWTQLANMFERDQALAQCLSVDDVPLEARRPVSAAQRRRVIRPEVQCQKLD